MARVKQEKAGYIVNPNTGNYVKIGSATYKKLMKEGYISPAGSPKRASPSPKPKKAKKKGSPKPKKAKKVIGHYDKPHKEGYIVNPTTGNYVKIGSATFKKLVKDGYITAAGSPKRASPSPKRKSPTKKLPLTLEKLLEEMNGTDYIRDAAETFIEELVRAYNYRTYKNISLETEYDEDGMDKTLSEILTHNLLTKLE